MVYLMLDAAELEIQENLDREGQEPTTEPEDPTKTALHQRLQERLNMGVEQNAQMQMLLILLEEDENANDDLYNGKYGKMHVSDQTVGALGLFKEGTANDSPENINGLLEVTMVAKQNFGDKEVHLSASGYTDEQLAMSVYAAQLTGLNNVADHGDLELSEEIRQKMDAAWATMQQDLGLETAPAPEEPTVAPEVQPEQQPGMDPNAPENQAPSPPSMGMGM